MTWRSPLAGDAIPIRRGNPAVPLPGVILAVIVGRDLVRVAPFAGQRKATSDILRALCKLVLPPVGKSSAKNGNVVAWAAMDAWLVMAPGTGRGELYGRLAKPLRSCAAVVDHTHGVTGIRVSGPKARDLLAKGCAVDLDPMLFAVGACAATQMEHTGVHLRRAGTDEYELLVPTSQVASFWHFFTEMALEFGYEVAEA